MDALELLKSDHDRMRSLLKQIHGESGKQQKKLLFDNVRADFEVHAYVEESAFFPAFRDFADLAHLLDQYLVDHKDTKALIQELSSTPIDAGDFNEKLKRLSDALTAHLDSEERSFFPLVRRNMKRAERERLGRHLQAVRQERTEAA